MPAVLAGRLAFAAPPKCGLTWLAGALAAAGVAVERQGWTRVCQPGRVGDLPTATLFRPPHEWLASCFAGQGRDGPTGVAEVDALWWPGSTPGTDFRAFVEDYLARTPGAVSRMLALYRADHAVLLADLPGGLADVLDAVGIPFDRAALLSCGPANVTRDRATWPADLLERFLRAEVC